MEISGGIPNIPQGPSLPIQGMSPPRPPEPSWADSRTSNPSASSSPSCQHCQSVPTPGFFSPWRGTPQLLVPAINPEQLKQQKDNGAVPATPPRLLRYHLGRELAELHRYRSGAPPPGIPGIRAGARRIFCSTAKKERSLSLSLSLSRRGAAPFHSQKFFSHFLTESRARSEPSLRSPHQQFLKPLGKYWAGRKANWRPAVPGSKIPATALAGSPNHGFKPPSATPAMGTGAKECWELQGQGFA